MSEEQIERSIRDLIDALEKCDVERALSFFAADAVWYAPEGEYKGTAELERYIAWMISPERGKDVKFVDTGIGILVKGNKAVYEYIWEATVEGGRIREPGVCIYEFSDGKCVYHRSVFDRLSAAKQGATGFIARGAVNTIVDQLEKGLH